MVVFLSVLFNILVCIASAVISVGGYFSYLAERVDTYKLITLIVLVILPVLLFLYSLWCLIKKLVALKKDSIIRSAFAIKKDLPLVAGCFALTAEFHTANPLSLYSILLAILSILGVVGLICTASVVRKLAPQYRKW